MNLQIVCIDIQNDFMDPNGALQVAGATEDAKRTTKMIKRLTPKINDLIVTMDSHNIVDISHPIWWLDDNGNPPGIFTPITAADVRAGKWHTKMNNVAKRSLEYLDELEKSGRYNHMIWPEHCIIGTPGHNLQSDFAEAVHYWERTRYATATKVTKGSNPFTEHYSAVRAEVPDPKDNTTQLNSQLIQQFETADILVWTGQALSHCLANTFRDTAAAFSNPDIIKKQVLLTDTTSNVYQCEKMGEDFIKEMVAKGMQLSTSVDFLA